MKTEETKKEAYKEIWRKHNKEREKKEKKIAAEQEARVIKYFKQRKGKMGQGEVLWSMRHDFFAFAEKKGGIW